MKRRKKPEIWARRKKIWEETKGETKMLQQA